MDGVDGGFGILLRRGVGVPLLRGLGDVRGLLGARGRGGRGMGPALAPGLPIK